MIMWIQIALIAAGTRASFPRMPCTDRNASDVVFNGGAMSAFYESRNVHVDRNSPSGVARGDGFGGDR